MREMPKMDKAEAQLLLAILEDTDEVLSSPDKNCRGALARNALGSSVSTRSPFATQWCLIGALYKVQPEENGLASRVREVLVINVPVKLQGHGLGWFNDNCGFDGVKALIALTKGKLQGIIAAAEETSRLTITK